LNLLSIPNSGPTISGTAHAGAKEATPLATSANGTIFKATLTSSVLALAAAKTTPKSSTAAATTTADGDLVQRIRDSLDRGTSPTDVIASLSTSLAASVASALGIPLDAAKQKLTAAFTAALTPTGTGPPQTNAERATSLAQRFRQIAELATRVTTEDPGQTIRSITGKSSDAEQAGAAPAPSPDTIIRDAAAALAGTASSVTPTTGTTPTTVKVPATPTASTMPATPGILAPAASNVPVLPAASATASDGRVVALPTVQAIATGGDTPLGRVLARAVISDQRNTGATAAPVIAPSEDAATAAAADLIGSASIEAATPAAKPLDAPASTVSTADPSSAPTAAHPTPATALDAFVAAFDAALRRDDSPHSTTAADPSLASTPVDRSLLTGTVATPIQALPSLAIPIANEITAIAPPAPAATMPQPADVDANAVVDQVLRGVSVRTTDGSSEVRLRLVPENLGDVSVKLVVSGGSVDASIITHSADAQNALAGAQNQLAKTLADAGLKLQSFTVALAGGASSGNPDQQPSGQSSGRSTRRTGGIEAASDEADETSDTALLAVPSFGPPIYAANPAFGYNYLV
jgi:flagellar hook-length control protein FliK